MGLVGGGEFPEFPNDQVVFWDLKKGAEAEADRLKLSKPVLSLKLTREWAVIGTEEGIYVARMDCTKVVKKVSLGGPREKGPQWPPTHISVTWTSPMFVAGGGMEVVLVEKGKEEKADEVCLAEKRFEHKEGVGCSAVSPDGKHYVTATKDGKKIRVFNCASGAKEAELDRGKDPVTIKSLTFSPDSSLVAISSSSGTIHVFSSGVGKCKKYSWWGREYVGYCNIKECGKNSWVHFGKEAEVRRKEVRYQLHVVEVGGAYRAYDVVVEDNWKISIMKRVGSEGCCFESAKK